MNGSSWQHGRPSLPLPFARPVRPDGVFPAAFDPPRDAGAVRTPLSDAYRNGRGQAAPFDAYRNDRGRAAPFDARRDALRNDYAFDPAPPMSAADAEARPVAVAPCRHDASPKNPAVSRRWRGAGEAMPLPAPVLFDARGVPLVAPKVETDTPSGAERPSRRRGFRPVRQRLRARPRRRSAARSGLPRIPGEGSPPPERPGCRP